MISEGIEVNQFTQFCLILEAKLGYDPLIFKETNISSKTLRVYFYCANASTIRNLNNLWQEKKKITCNRPCSCKHNLVKGFQRNRWSCHWSLSIPPENIRCLIGSNFCFKLDKVLRALYLMNRIYRTVFTKYWSTGS